MSTSPQNARLLQTFLDLVCIDSPSGRESGVAKYCVEALSSAGCDVSFDDSAERTGSDVGNLIAVLPGTAPGVLVLSAHMDCVDPCEGVVPEIREGVVFSSGDTVLGGDDKAGLAGAIECVRRLAEEGGEHPTVRCVFTVQEEVGLTGAKALAATDAQGDLCLVLDGDGTPGGIVIAAPTHYTFTAVFEGVPSHAGVRPEAGISAVRMAADAIMRCPLGRLDAQSTANIGSISGGTATNVVPGRATVTGECRSLDRERVEEIRSQMDSALHGAAEEAGGRVRVDWTLEYAGFSVDEYDDRVRLVADACVDMGLEPRTYTTGGGSDANILAALGVPVLVLACGMDGVHGTSERISVTDLETLAALCVAVARRMASRKGMNS